MTPQYIMRKSLCREPSCASKHDWKRTAESYIENLNYVTEYAEPGYDNPRKGILFCNWNYFPRDLCDVLEKYGYSIEWEDEWTRCNGCYRGLRTSPDSYMWQPSYIMNDNGCYCVDCLDKDDIETLENNPRQALNIHNFDPTKYNYVRIEGEFETGLRECHTTNPKDILARIRAEHGQDKRYLFVRDSTGQFNTEFSIWAKESTMT